MATDRFWGGGGAVDRDRTRRSWTATVHVRSWTATVHVPPYFSYLGILVGGLIMAFAAPADNLGFTAR